MSVANMWLLAVAVIGCAVILFASLTSFNFWIKQ